MMFHTNDSAPSRSAIHYRKHTHSRIIHAFSYFAQTSTACAAGLIRDERVLGTEVFANMPDQGKSSAARELLDHVRKRFTEMTSDEVTMIKQQFWNPPQG